MTNKYLIDLLFLVPCTVGCSAWAYTLGGTVSSRKDWYQDAEMRMTWAKTGALLGFGISSVCMTRTTLIKGIAVTSPLLYIGYRMFDDTRYLFNEKYKEKET